LRIVRQMFAVGDSRVGDFITFIAEQFGLLGKAAEVRELPAEVLDMIFQSPVFRFTRGTYDWLLGILEERGDAFMPTFKKAVFANFRELTQDNLRDFVGYIDDDDFPEAAEVIQGFVTRDPAA